MTNAMTVAMPDNEVEELHQLASVVINEHRSDHDLCAICGCTFSCERAVLAEHNLAL